MATLYLRNVPEPVVERLQRLAAREGASVNAIAVRELTEWSRRADNPALLGALLDLNIDAHEIVADLEAERVDR
jgi:plasmid stability protein